MRAAQTYEWATDKVETVTKQHREAQACERWVADAAPRRSRQRSHCWT